MKTIKTSILVSILLFGMTTSVFASWWNPFTWSFFTKKQNQKIETTINANVVKQENSVDEKENTTANPIKIEKTGLFISTSTNQLIFTEAEKLIKYNYSDYSCGYYQRKPDCNDVITYDSYKGQTLEVDGVNYKIVEAEKQKITQALGVDVTTFTFAPNVQNEVKKFIETGLMNKTTLKSSSNYEDIIKGGNQSKITPENPVKVEYVVGQDNKNKYYLVTTRFGCGGDIVGCNGSVYLEKKSVVSGAQVDGMSKYVDSDFGFSFWYPSSSTVNEIPLRGFSKSDQQIIKRLSVVVSGQEIWIDEVDSPSRTFNVEAGACGYCGPVRYFFDTELHSWMKVYPSGLNGAPDATPDQMTASKMPKLADISNNTMGGLHIFSTEQKENASIVPLSAKHFLEIIEPSGKNPGSNIQIPLVKTVVATDPTVAVPVSMEKQIQFIRDEASTYSH